MKKIELEMLENSELVKSLLCHSRPSSTASIPGVKIFGSKVRTPSGEKFEIRGDTRVALYQSAPDGPSIAEPPISRAAVLSSDHEAGFIH